jgi:hypothetical protein
VGLPRRPQLWCACVRACVRACGMHARVCRVGIATLVSARNLMLCPCTGAALHLGAALPPCTHARPHPQPSRATRPTRSQPRLGGRR